MELVAYRVGAAVGAVAGHWGQESLLANGVGEAPAWNGVSGLAPPLKGKVDAEVCWESRKWRGGPQKALV